MRNILIWSGSALVTVAVVALGVYVSAAPGDGIYVAAPVKVEALGAAAKSAGATAVKNAFGVPVANVTRVNCWREPTDLSILMCNACGNVALSDEEYMRLDLAGQLRDPMADDVEECLRATAVSNLADFDVYTQAAHGIVLDNVYSFEMHRRDGAPAIVDAMVWEIKSASPAEYRALKRAGGVVKILSVAQ